MFKTKEEAIEFAKDLIAYNDDWFSTIQVWPTKEEELGHTEDENCVCKPRVEKDGVYKILHHNLIIH